MIVVMVRIPAASDEAAEGVVERFRNRAGMVDNQPGFRGFELLRGEGEIISVSRWDSRADLDRWMESQGHGQAHRQSGGEAKSGAPASTGGGVSIYEIAIPLESGS